MRNFLRLTALAIALTLAAIASFNTLFAKKEEQQGPISETVVLIMIDGLRQDVAYSGSDTLKQMIKQGIAFRGRAVFPTQTIVNFMSLATGSYPEKHGFVGGYGYRDAKGAWVAYDATNIATTTLFEVLEANGKRGAFLGLKGYDLFGVGGAKTTLVVDGKQLSKDDPQIHYGNKYEIDWAVNDAEARSKPALKGDFAWGWASDDRVAKQPAEKSFANKVRMSQVLVRHGLDRLRQDFSAEGARHLIVLNLGSTDLIAHTFGPKHPNYRRAVREMVDGAAFFIEELKKIYAGRRLTLIVAADHGFTDTATDKRTLEWDYAQHRSAFLDSTFADFDVIIKGCGGHCLQLFVHRPQQAEAVFKKLRQARHGKNAWVDKIYTHLEMKKADGRLQELRAYFPGRSATFTVDLKKDWAIGKSWGHGSARPENFNIPMIFSGAGIVKRGRIINRRVPIVDVAPTVLHLLGLESPKNWDGRVVRRALSTP